MDTNTLPSTITWQAPRVHNHERSPTWYLIGGIAVIACTVFGVLTGAWSLAIVCILCGALYFLVRDHQFPDISCTLTSTGVNMGETYMSWEQVKGYWFIVTPTYTELHIVPLAARMPDLVIQTGSIPIMDIRAFLSGKTKEMHEKQERIFDILLRLSKL